MSKHIENKLKRSAPKKMDKQMEYDYLQKYSTERAKDKLKAEPYQLKCRREHGAQRAEQ